ncbi:hypothetical protein EJB05_32929, partial [Eragrostis curvula]
MLRLSLPCCLLLLFSFLPAPDAQEFVYNGFADAGLTFEGEASIESGRLGLTSGLEIGGIGHAFYRYPVSFETIPGGPIVPSFTTTFVFEISMFEDYNPRGKGSDGLAFVLSSTNKFLDDSLPGQYLGLFNMSNRGNNSKNILAIELGDIVKPELSGTDNNHVAININNLTSINSHTAGYYYSSYGGFQFLTLASDGALQLWVETGDGRLHFQLEHDWTALHLSPTDEVDKSFVRIGHSAGRLNKKDPISHRQGIPKCTANRYGHSVSNLAIPADRSKN